MRALRDMNLPKFVFEDVPLFLGLIADLFPGLDCPRVRYPNFNDAVEGVLQDNKYVMLPQQVRSGSVYCILIYCYFKVAFYLSTVHGLPKRSSSCQFKWKGPLKARAYIFPATIL